MESAAVSEARRIYERFQDEHLAASALGSISDWVSGGEAPPAAELRSAGFVSDGDPSLKVVRLAFARAWGFAIPCAEMIEALLPLSPLVELGAGTGYLSALLHSAGADVIATDVLETGAIGYRYSPGRHAAVEACDGAEAVIRYPERNVLCSWPTEGDGWALRAARNVRSGRAFCLIGEPSGGHNSTPAFYDFLSADFDLIKEVVTPQFFGCHDRFWIYLRR